MFTTKLFRRAVLLCASISIFVSIAEAGTLMGSYAAVPQGSTVDLTATGAIDWVHWGLYTDTSLTRKAGVAPQISDFTLLLPSSMETNAGTLAFQYSDNFNGYSWRDGTPDVSGTDTPTGVWAYGF